MHWVVFWTVFRLDSLFGWLDYTLQCGSHRLLADQRVKLRHIYGLFYSSLYSPTSQVNVRWITCRILKMMSRRHAASSWSSCMFNCTENECEKCMRAFSFLIHRSNYISMSPPPPCSKWKTNQEVQLPCECTWQTSVTNHRRLDRGPEDMLDWISIKLAAASFGASRCIGATAKTSSLRRGTRQNSTGPAGNSPHSGNTQRTFSFWVRPSSCAPPAEQLLAGGPWKQEKTASCGGHRARQRPQPQRKQSAALLSGQLPTGDACRTVY